MNSRAGKGVQHRARNTVGERNGCEDANHPSILFWSNGNEGGHNKELDDDYATYDLSNRTVIHCHHRPKRHDGIDCNHYEDFYSTQKL